jgi:hypothetical protein
MLRALVVAPDTRLRLMKALGSWDLGPLVSALALTKVKHVETGSFSPIGQSLIQ